jgi:squalene-associated FAD-dependent desaturase
LEPGVRRALVVGGGFAGAAAATALAEGGIAVTLLEAHGHLGGRWSSSAPSDMFPAPFDNSPHLLLGCNREALALFKRLGASKELRWHDPLSLSWIAPGGWKSSLSAWPLPAPLHLALGLWFSDAIPGPEKNALSEGLRSLCFPDLRPDWRELTVAAFLGLSRQGPVSTERFWMPLTRSVANLPPEEAPLSLLASVMRRTFSGRRSDSAVGLARLPLGDVLFPRLAPWLEARGGRVLTRRPARGFTRHEDRFRVGDTSGDTHEGDVLVWAVPPWFLAAHLGSDPPPVGGEPQRLEKSAIVAVHAILDREVLSGPFIGLAGGRFDWAFNRNENWGWRSPAGRGQYLSLVASAAGDLASRGDGEIVSRALGELRERLAFRAASFEVRASKVVREMAATPRLDPASLRFRSPVLTDEPGMFLAGDWTDTGLPATVEGASLSGHRAARAALDFLRSATA